MAVIAITGTPGTGKTGMAGELAKMLGWKLVELNRLAEEHGLYAGYDRQRKCRIVDIGLISKEVGRLAKKHGNLIIESHYAQDMPCDVVVVLRANPAELRKRLEAKGWPSRKIEENIEAEIMEVIRSEAVGQGKKVLEIDTTAKKPGKVAEEIMKKLKNFL